LNFLHIFLKNIQSDFFKLHPVRTELLRVDGRTDGWTDGQTDRRRADMKQLTVFFAIQRKRLKTSTNLNDTHQKS